MDIHEEDEEEDIQQVLNNETLNDVPKNAEEVLNWYGMEDETDDEEAEEVQNISENRVEEPDENIDDEDEEAHAIDRNQDKDHFDEYPQPESPLIFEPREWILLWILKKEEMTHKIEKLIFLDLKLRALLLFLSSVRVTEAFKKQLEEYRCICRYDEHKQNAWIQSDCNEICVEGEHRKVAKNGKKKGKKNGKNGKIRKDEEQEDDDDDEDHDEKADDDDNAVVVDNEDDEVKANDEKVDDEEKDGDGKPDDDYMAVADDKEEDHLNAIPTMMTVGKLFAKLKEQLETYFEEKQQDMSLHLSLKKETEMKKKSLSGLAKLVIAIRDE
ncbi:hypothetical protein CRE_14700 [Caenorhabditis remanei]|uniref:SPK domain-containing protein n=1 Tax=Caenorhabditis remanei TaxID=31234 RepID=E3M9N0_CAERE|nr:hypothetical protein CRE_14700 [Caenorhabditis remanei]